MKSFHIRKITKKSPSALLGMVVIGTLAATIPVSADTESGADQTAAEDETVLWQNDFEQALADAGDREKNVLLRFTADWCPPCRVMDANVWPEEKVLAAVEEHVIPVLVDIDETSNRPLVFRYGIRMVPTLVLVDVDGNEITRTGFMSAPETVAFLQSEKSDG